MAIGDIIREIASYEFDPDVAFWTPIIHVAGNIYVIAYEGPDNSGWMKSVRLNADGTIGGVIDSFEFDAKGQFPRIAHVAGNVYAVAFRGFGSDGWLMTVLLDDEGFFGTSGKLWRRPTGYEDPSANWANPENAYDDDIGTFAYSPSIPVGEWSSFLVLTHAAGSCDRIKYYLGRTIGVDLVDIDVEWGGSFNHVFEGEPTWGAWEEKIFAENDITAVRFRFHCAEGANQHGQIFECQLYTASSEIDVLEFDTDRGYAPFIFHISGNVFAIAYGGPSNHGLLKTVTIEDGGSIGSVIDSLEFDTSYGDHPCVIHVSGSVYAIAYRGPGSDGWLKTVSIESNGQIGDSVINFLEFDTVHCYHPEIIHVSGDVFAIAYHGYDVPAEDYAGWLLTVSIDSEGVIGDPSIDKKKIDTYGEYSHIVHIAEDVYAIAYMGPDYDGWLKTVSIESGGSIGEIIDFYEFDTDPSLTIATPFIISIGSVYAIAYQGPSADGWLKTIEIESAVAPTVVTNPALNITEDSALLAGELSDDGGEACDCGFEWGETDAYGNTTPTESKTTGESFSQPLTGLSSGTTYHFRAFATNSVGTGYGADRTFNTLFVCPYCGETFATEEEREAHIAAEHPNISISRAYALSREEL